MVSYRIPHKRYLPEKPTNPRKKNVILKKGELIASHHVLTPTHAFAHHKIHLNADALER